MRKDEDTEYRYRYSRTKAQSLRPFQFVVGLVQQLSTSDGEHCVQHVHRWHNEGGLMTGQAVIQDLQVNHSTANERKETKNDHGSTRSISMTMDVLWSMLSMDG
jgi:hypothetical protein